MSDHSSHSAAHVWVNKARVRRADLRLGCKAKDMWGVDRPALMNAVHKISLAQSTIGVEKHVQIQICFWQLFFF